MIILNLTDKELEALQSLCCTADLQKITEESMPGLSTLFTKIYTMEKQITTTFSERLDK